MLQCDCMSYIREYMNIDKKRLEKLIHNKDVFEVTDGQNSHMFSHHFIVVTFPLYLEDIAEGLNDNLPHVLDMIIHDYQNIEILKYYADKKQILTSYSTQVQINTSTKEKILC